MQRFLLGLLRVTGLALLLLVGGCRLGNRERNAGVPAFDLAQVLPPDWESLDDGREINLDSDEPVEYLLLFSYDSGQVGALIYDANVAPPSAPAPTLMPNVTNAPPITAPVPVPASSLPAFRNDQLYRLLPNHWTTGQQWGQGMIAPPGVEVEVFATTAQVSDDPTQPRDELVLLGGNTHVTWVWWQPQTTRYQVAQLYAPGGFIEVDWAAWRREPEPLLRMTGLHPLDDYRGRSQICRAMRYQRRTTASSDPAPDSDPATFPTIAFDTADLGLTFCATFPRQPFYPEGVVLAYLLGPRPGGDDLAGLVSDEYGVMQLDADLNYARLAVERIEDLATYPSLPMSPNQATGQATNGEAQPSALSSALPLALSSTIVCVELVEIADPQVRRWVLVTLRYHAADVTQGLIDRWRIAGAQPEPLPVTPPGAGYCNQILARNAP